VLWITPRPTFQLSISATWTNFVEVKNVSESP
jgi:hypothetical protein